MSSPHAVTIIARDQVEVATKIAELITSVDVGSDEIIDFDVCTYGANQFLITLVYQDIWTIRSFVAKLGTKVALSRVFLIKRSYTSKVGLKTVFGLPVHGKPAQLVKVGLKTLFAFKQKAKLLSVKLGVKTSVGRIDIYKRNVILPKMGFKQKVQLVYWQLGTDTEMDYTY